MRGMDEKTLTEDWNGPPDHNESIFKTVFSAPGGPNGMAVYCKRPVVAESIATYLLTDHFQQDMLP